MSDFEKWLETFKHKMWSEMSTEQMLAAAWDAATIRAVGLIEQEAERQRGRTMGDWLPGDLNRLADKIRD